MSEDGLIIGESPVQRAMGFVVDISAPDRRARCYLDLDQHHMNRNGILHGGIISTILDVAAGFTASMTVDDTGKAPFQTVSLNVQFLAPAKDGRITATGNHRGGGQSTVFIDAELKDEEGKLLAIAQGVFKRLRRESETGAS